MNQFPEKIRHDRVVRRKADYDDGDFSDFAVTYQPVKAGIFNIYLFGGIEHARQFIGPIEALHAAGEDDTVVVHLSTFGGSLDATDTFLSAMDECEGRVVVRASGGVHSAGSVILMHAKEFTLSANFNCLIHNGSCGAGGDFNKFVAWAKHNQEYMESIMRETYEGFLSPSEIQAMIDGKDFWLGPEEFCKRWEQRNQYMQGQMDKLQQLLSEQKPALIEAPPQRKPRKKRS